MKRATYTLLLAICSILITTVLHAQTTEVLTNQDVIQLHGLQLGDEIILSKIDGTLNNFDLSTDALVALKGAGVTGNVITRMMTAANDPSKKAVDKNDPLSPHMPGIYYVRDGRMNEVLANVCAQSKKTGGYLNVITRGWSPVTRDARLAGPRAQMRATPGQEFYFYFKDQAIPMGQSNNSYYGFWHAVSPNEFSLVRMREVDGSRTMQTGSSTAMSSESGVDETQIVSFTIEPVTQGVYKVILDPGMPAGEFCFMYSGTTPGAGDAQKLFDFGL